MTRKTPLYQHMASAIDAMKRCEADAVAIRNGIQRGRVIMVDTSDIADAICDRWIAVCGMGFNPDTRAADYEPLLPDPDAYERDMDWLWRYAADPYDCGLHAMARAGLPVG